MASSGLTRSGNPPQFHLDEKWKLSKQDGFCGGASRITSSSSFNGKKTQKQRRCGFTSKCARLVKGHRARFYIMRRCVIMLVCWRDNYSDS